MFACVHAPDCPSEKLLALASSFSPLVEDTASGTVIFSIVGLGRLIGGPREIAAVIARRGSEAGIQGNLAIAADPDTALLAARHIAGVTVIPPGKEAGRLSGLPVEGLPCEEERTAAALCVIQNWGIRTLGELAELPPLGLIARFGEEGERLLRLARGETRRSLRAIVPSENYERGVELEHPLRLLEPLLFVIASLFNELMRGLAFNRVTLGLKLANKSEHSCTLEFPVPVRDSKVLLKQLQFDLEAHPPKSAIVAVRVRLQPAAARVLQHGLFLPQAPAPEKLQLTLARLTALLGEGNVGSPELLDTHRPDAFVMRPLNPDAATPGSVPPATALRFAFRYYRPPLPAQVRLESERPVIINAQPVLTAAGPWRASGDWWTDAGWKREEWDVELGNGGLYRVFSALYSNHARWFLEGVYD